MLGAGTVWYIRSSRLPADAALARWMGGLESVYVIGRRPLGCWLSLPGDGLPSLYFWSRPTKAGTLRLGSSCTPIPRPALGSRSGVSAGNSQRSQLAANCPDNPAPWLFTLGRAAYKVTSWEKNGKAGTHISPHRRCLARFPSHAKTRLLQEILSLFDDDPRILQKKKGNHFESLQVSHKQPSISQSSPPQSSLTSSIRAAAACRLISLWDLTFSANIPRLHL